MTEYAIWKPEHNGHAPPNWREGMAFSYRYDDEEWRAGIEDDEIPLWYASLQYQVPAEALNSPNDDAKLGVSSQVEMAIELVTRQPAEVLARYGITLAPEKDWATELWADLLEAYGYNRTAELIREGKIVEDDHPAIELLRTRFEQMKGEG